MPDLETAQLKVSGLFNLMGIKRVVCIDDYYDVTENAIFELCLQMKDLPNFKSIDELKDIDFETDVDDWHLQLTDQLKTISNDDLNYLHKKLFDLQPPTTSHSPNLIATLLNSSAHPFIGISYNEWKNQEQTLIEEGKDGSTLFLFDQYLGVGRDDQGMRLIQELVLKYNENEIICGLLSGTFSPQDEYPLWNKYAEEYGVGRDHFLLISKKHEIYEDSAAMIKLIVLNRLCYKLKLEVHKKIQEAHELTQKEVQSIDIYDFEHIVFKTSLNEGVWEPDTLLRLFGIYQRHNVLESAYKNAQIRNLVKSIHQTIGVKISNKGKPSAVGRKLMHLERFEEQDYLNQHHIPLDLGDIFEVINSDGNNKKLFMLTTQSCDLMIRPTGKRGGKNEGVLTQIVEIAEDEAPEKVEGVLTQIVELPKDNTPEKIDEKPKMNSSNKSHESHNDPFHELLYYAWEKEDKTYFVDFRKSININLKILDLCVFNEYGMAEFNRDTTLPENIMPNLEQRYKEIKNYFINHLDKYEKYRGKVDTQTLTLLIPASNLDRTFKGTYSDADKTLNYKLQRIGRLRQPASGEVLLRLANYNARTAFDHELDREMDMEHDSSNIQLDSSSHQA